MELCLQGWCDDSVLASWCADSEKSEDAIVLASWCADSERVRMELCLRVGALTAKE
jgi:hypothetical protein